MTEEQTDMRIVKAHVFTPTERNNMENKVIIAEFGSTVTAMPGSTVHAPSDAIRVPVDADAIRGT